MKIDIYSLNHSIQFEIDVQTILTLAWRVQARPRQPLPSLDNITLLYTESSKTLNGLIQKKLLTAFRTMGQKRKRPIKDNLTREKSSGSQHQPTSTPHLASANKPRGSNAEEISHPVISLYYPQVVTLRQYILQRIPRSSKSRRRRIVAVRKDAGADGPFAATNVETDGNSLAELLDTTLVGLWKDISPTHTQERRRDFVAFTQAQQATQFGTDTGPASPQSEVGQCLLPTIPCVFADVRRS